MAKPGVMFYFDIRPCIKRLTLVEKGQLFEAILDYAELGNIPEFDGVLGVAWDFLQPKLDRDTVRYDKQIAQKQYAAFVREVKKAGGTPIPFDEWKTISNVDRKHLISPDIGRYPTTTPNLQTTTSTDIINRADKPPTRSKFGEYQNVLLTDDELKRLKADIPNCLQLIERLSEYMASTGKKYKSHYATIRAWSRKESPIGQSRLSTPMPDYGGELNCSL